MDSGEPSKSEIQTKLLSFDPRSPSTEFTRTPIVVETRLPVKIHNKNLDNARKELITVTPRVSKIVPPKLLDSSPISPKSNSKRRSLIGLLETNIDYTETDLDQVTQDKKQASVNKSAEIDPRSPTVEFIRTPLQIAKKISELDLNDTKDDIASNYDESLQDFDEPEPDTNLPDVILVNSQPEVQETETNVKEFDSKLTNLIYEDEETVVTVPRAVKLVEGSRTPLGTRDSNKEPRKSISKLRVSDKPTKEKYAVSKIPVFKEKRLKGRNLQCENTPPRKSMEPMSVGRKKSQWDTDNTLII